MIGSNGLRKPFALSGLLACAAFFSMANSNLATFLCAGLERVVRASQ